MPQVTKDGKPSGSYGYDIGGKTTGMGSSVERGDKMPPSGQLGRMNKENTDRFVERKGGNDSPSKTYAKTGYESTAFTKDGCVKGGPSSDVKFLESDGTWAPAEGRGGTRTGVVPKAGVYSKTIKK